ncbi:MAG: FimB/Mfa2 family fimbrial subunit [Rikenellaceae bacterium]|nr:FimB/Mfa2 family fimbrial subunit [Rikenellaceae bacterium]
MNKIAGALTALLALTAGLSSCLKEDNSDCPETLPPVALRFVFTHHDHTEEVTDLFSEFVEDVHLYIFDMYDNYVYHIDTPQSSLVDGNTLYLDIEEGEYKMVVWGNLFGTGYEVIGSSSATTRTGFTIQASENHTGVADLFHGMDAVTVDSTFKTYDISLIRDTHIVRIRLLGLDEPTRTIEGTDYTVSVEGSNIVYDFENNPAAGNATASYIPTYSGFTEENTYVAQAEFKLQRLFIGDDLTLRILEGDVVRTEDKITERILQAYEDIETDEDLDKHYIYELYYEADRYGGWIFVGNSIKDWDGSSMPGEL